MSTEKRKDDYEQDRFWKISMAVVTGLSVMTALYCRKQLKSATKLINKAAEKISDVTIVDVNQAIVDSAIRNSVDREVKHAISRTLRLCEDEIINESSKRVNAAVQQSYGKISKAVTDSIAKAAAKVDQNEIMEAATEKAKELLLERFDGKLDGLMADYQRNLDNVGKIYQSIASSMADKAGKDVTLKLG